MMNELKQKQLSAVRGCMIGGAIGDALGYPVEFISRNSILSRFGPDGICAYEYGGEGLAEISDDTQMALFTANGLLASHAWGAGQDCPDAVLGSVYKAYLDWNWCQKHLDVPKGNTSFLSELPEMHARRAPGNTCMSALASGKAGSIDEPVNHSKGCGGVMRVAPVPLFYGTGSLDIHRIALLGAETAALTHGHPLGYMPAAALAYIIHRAVFGGCSDLYAITAECMDAMKTIFKDIPARGVMLDLMDQAVQLSRNDQADADNIARLGEGWTAEQTLAIALYCSLKYQNDFSKAIIASVNHSGDSDSTGAVTGNIMGALVGMEGIGDEWLRNLELRRVILEIADDLFIGSSGVLDMVRNDPAWTRKYVRHHLRENFDLQRFRRAQDYNDAYACALEEIRSGRKRSCWMWYIFPQLQFLGHSEKAKYFGIVSLDHAKAYLGDPVLGPRLREISAALLKLDENDPLAVMGSPDHLKLQSCMTLFNSIERGKVFWKVLKKYYGGREDQATLNWLRNPC